jgi:hypothetical protein
VSFAAITLCVASQGVFIVVNIYVIITSIHKLLNTLSYYLKLNVAMGKFLFDLWVIIAGKLPQETLGRNSPS